MKQITITASKTYSVFMDAGLLASAGELTRKALGKRAVKLCIVSDDVVSPLYAQTVSDALTASGFQVCTFVFPHGENSKSLKTLGALLEFLAEEQLTRTDGLIALGGGVTGDLTGFAAASYLRGIPFVQIPTTLLAAVDSSVGGKTGVNLKAGKNLAGAFWQPSLVLFDLDTIKTLSYELQLDGIAEAIKAGAIADADLFQFIKAAEKIDDPKTIAHLVSRAIEIKRTVVEADERDTGARQLLNFGHTIGHGIEKCSCFTISHGHAVAIGMAVIAKAAAASGWSEEDCTGPICGSLLRFGFSLDCPYSAAELTNAALKDKKRAGHEITLVIPTRLGECRLKKLPITQLESFIEKGLSS